ncbi:MAG: hypothetical protein V1702_01120 [Candidatus Woesearchaeota archaeon]
MTQNNGLEKILEEVAKHEANITGLPELDQYARRARFMAERLSGKELDGVPGLEINSDMIKTAPLIIDQVERATCGSSMRALVREGILKDASALASKSGIYRAYEVLRRSAEVYSCSKQSGNDTER